jgi:hypothetical protein
VSEFEVVIEGSSSRVVERRTMPDGSIRESFVQTYGGVTLTGSSLRGPLSRWERFARSRLGRFIPQPWASYIDCHGSPRLNGCYWNPSPRQIVQRHTICRWRGHCLATIWSGEWDMCCRCHLDVRYDDEGQVVA